MRLLRLQDKLVVLCNLFGHRDGVSSRTLGLVEPAPYTMLTSNRVSQAVTNKLSSFNIQRFRLAAFAQINKTNKPLSTFESLVFRDLIASANLQAEDALQASYYSISSYILRLYDYLKPQVI